MGLLSYASLTYSSAALLLLLSVFAFGYRLAGYSTLTYVMFALLAVVPQLIGHSSLNWALRFLPATLITIAILGEPIMATTLAFLILEEMPTLNEIGGGILILTGIFIAFRLHHRFFGVSPETLEKLAATMLKQLEETGRKYKKEGPVENAETLKVKIYAEVLDNLTKQDEWHALFKKSENPSPRT